MQAMQNNLPGRQVAAIINQTLVAAGDPAFDSSTRFVGEVFEEAEAKELAARRGWTVRRDGSGWRRVVGSPRPQSVVETRLIRLLLNSGAVVVCAGGGGVPVIRNEQGHLEGSRLSSTRISPPRYWQRRWRPTPCWSSPTCHTSCGVSALPTS